ncbi:hypothetical protein CDD82_7040 [Ophiocordyceps australis]|uniref:Conserved oligomeric Golgi complex subunit 2 n=1 Tax=Ophiocordyceps australis TaxID=1399860 RepID=A0A2C5YUH5_9HYPO|nr:hypothetical protein CDD82_7040 [Ophiocordyceps australis]
MAPNPLPHDLALDPDAPLPFPTALPRSDFIVPSFDAAAYLSALPHRHQTLADLRADLRDRSAAISAELVQLVNDNYTAFLSLGADLAGGDQRVQSVRVALLGFRRAVAQVKARVAEKRLEAQSLCSSLATVRADVEKGRTLLEINDRLEALEDSLRVDGPSDALSDWSSVASDEQDDAEAAVHGLLASSPAKLLHAAHQCNRICSIASTLDDSHPFVVKMQQRLTKCRTTLLLDLGNALKEARGAGPRAQDRVLKYLEIYRILDAQREAIQALGAR